jgi:hypothetical protein
MRVNGSAVLDHEIAFQRPPTTQLKPIPEATTDAIADQQSLAPKLAIDRMHNLFQGEDCGQFDPYDAWRTPSTDRARESVDSTGLDGRFQLPFIPRLNKIALISGVQQTISIGALNGNGETYSM